LARPFARAGLPGFTGEFLDFVPRFVYWLSAPYCVWRAKGSRRRAKACSSSWAGICFVVALVIVEPVVFDR